MTRLLLLSVQRIFNLNEVRSEVLHSSEGALDAFNESREIRRRRGSLQQRKKHSKAKSHIFESKPVELIRSMGDGFQIANVQCPMTLDVSDGDLRERRIKHKGTKAQRKAPSNYFFCGLPLCLRAFVFNLGSPEPLTVALFPGWWDRLWRRVYKRLLPSLSDQCPPGTGPRNREARDPENR